MYGDNADDNARQHAAAAISASWRWCIALEDDDNALVENDCMDDDIDDGDVWFFRRLRGRRSRFDLDINIGWFIV